MPIDSDLLTKIGRSFGPNQIVSKTPKLFHVEIVALLPMEMRTESSIQRVALQLVPSC